MAHRFGRMGLAAVGRRDRGGEEILQFETAAIGRHVFVGGHPRHRRFVHLDRVRHRLEVERAQMCHAVGEEAVLLAHDLGRHLEDGAGALIQRAHQPGGVLQAIGEIGFVAVLADRLRQLGVIDLIDQHARQRVAVEFDVPAAVGSGPHIDIRHHGLGAGRTEFQARLRIEAANFADHVGDVFVVDTAEFSQRGDIALGQQVEMLDQRLHRRIVAVEFAQLDRKALAQISRADAGRIELLQHRQHRLDLRLRRAQPLGRLTEIRRHVTGLVDEVDQILADHAARGIGEGHRQLLGKMAAERHLGGDEGFEIVAVIVGSAAAPFGVGGRRRVLGGARGGLGRLLGKYVVQRRIQRLLDLGAAAEVAIHPFFLARLEAVAGRSARHIGTLGAGILAIGGGRIGRIVRSGIFAPLRRRLARHRGLGTVAGTLQQRISLQFFLDKGRKVQIGQLQQLDRLHQLRRHHQRL